MGFPPEVRSSTAAMGFFGFSMKGPTFGLPSNPSTGASLLLASAGFGTGGEAGAFEAVASPTSCLTEPGFARESDARVMAKGRARRRRRVSLRRRTRILVVVCVKDVMVGRDIRIWGLKLRRESLTCTPNCLRTDLALVVLSGEELGAEGRRGLLEGDRGWSGGVVWVKMIWIE